MDIYTVYGFAYDLSELEHCSIGKSFLDHKSAIGYIKTEIEEVTSFLKECYEYNQIGKYYVESIEYYENNQTFGEYTICVNLNFDNDEHREFADMGKCLFPYHDWEDIEIAGKEPDSKVRMYMLKLKLVREVFE